MDEETITIGSAQLSKIDILYERKKGNLIITPFQKGNLKSASFDITPSCLIMSVKTGRFMKIHSENKLNWKNHIRKSVKKPLDENSVYQSFNEKYVMIPPRDTALVLTREYIKLPLYMAGNVFSRVSAVSSGLGHVSTTIDPGWSGALLIAISNPSNKSIKLKISDANAKSIPLATVTLQYLNSPIKEKFDSNCYKPARVDILEKYLREDENVCSHFQLLKKCCSRHFYNKDYILTAMIIKRLSKMSNIKPKDWKKELKGFEELVLNQKMKSEIWTRIFDIGMQIGIVLILAIIFLLFSKVFNGKANYVQSVIIVLFTTILNIFITASK